MWCVCNIYGLMCKFKIGIQLVWPHVHLHLNGPLLVCNVIKYSY